MINLLMVKSDCGDFPLCNTTQEAAVQPSYAVPAKQGPKHSLALSIPGTLSPPEAPQRHPHYPDLVSSDLPEDEEAVTH